MKTGKTRRALRKTASLLGDLDALTSLDPTRILRHWVNKAIGRRVHHETQALFLKERAKKK